MKDGVGIVNCARGGVIDEVALVKARQRKSIIRRLRCFESEPKPEMTILMHPKVSLTPHIGATGEAKIELEQNLLHKLSVY
jgi:D-3-phosphoglycerate dehydrogenase